MLKSIILRQSFNPAVRQRVLYPSGLISTKWKQVGNDEIVEKQGLDPYVKVPQEKKSIADALPLLPTIRKGGVPANLIVPQRIAVKRESANLPQEYTPPNRELAIPSRTEQRCLRVSLLGPANAGKSTLVNALVGASISAVSNKAQTTREQVLGIVTRGKSQIVFFDTPGVVPHHHRKLVSRSVLTSTWNALPQSDLILLVLDANKLIFKPATPIEKHLFTRLAKESNTPAHIIFNKIDTLGAGDPQSPHIEDPENIWVNRLKGAWANRYSNVQGVHFISALAGINLNKIQQTLFSIAETTQRPWLFQDPSVTLWQSPVNIIESLLREALFSHLHSYLPYIIKSEVLEIGDPSQLPDDERDVKFQMWVDRPGQERILIGRGGKVISSIVDMATTRIKEILGWNVRLHAHVRIRKRRYGK